MGKLMREVGFAFVQVMRTGSQDQIAKAADVLAGTRRELYRILADGDTGDTADGDTGDTGVTGDDTDAGADAGTVDENR
jgi:hypothetical protein